MQDIKGKIAWVTGAGTGIGEAAAKALAAEGVIVILTGRRKEPLEKVPYRFRLGFEDEHGKPHWLSVIDWEFFQLWRKERDRFHSEEKAADQVRKKIETIASADNDLMLFAGNLANPAMRRSFMILGCCYAKKKRQTELF